MPWTMLAATRAFIFAAAGEDAREQGEEGAAEAEEHVGAEAGCLVAPLALEADETAAEAGHEEALDGAAREQKLVERAEVVGRQKNGVHGFAMVAPAAQGQAGQGGVVDL